MGSDASVTRLGSGLFASCDAFETTGCIFRVLFTRHEVPGGAWSVSHASSVQLVVGCMSLLRCCLDCSGQGQAPLSAVVCRAAVVATTESEVDA